MQGVGFRPAAYRLAKTLSLGGIIFNDTSGVQIEIQGNLENIHKFIERLQIAPAKPPLATIDSIKTEKIKPIEDTNSFIIKTSCNSGEIISQVTANIATCKDCLAELNDKNDFRYRYPFINCTNCGPRYSIVKTVPYDRPNTTMSPFEMCSACRSQYEDVTDRRFHAQPVACNKCGPKIFLIDNQNNCLEQDSDQAIAATAELLRNGKIVAIKGIGGFHLAVNALDDKAVKRLRKRKKRDKKPFAIMANSISNIKKYALVNALEEQILTSPQAPIVLLEKRNDINTKIAESVAEGVSSFGFMVCYTPLHWLLMGENLELLVMTSANVSDEPLICDNDIAIKKLSHIADAFLMHNRQIFRQIDDSIVQVINNQPSIIRRARGYVPTPIKFIAGDNNKAKILATGTDLKNTFALCKNNQIICSEHIGDLENSDVFKHYRNSITHMQKLFDFEPDIIAHDLHPGYLSSEFATSFKNKKTIKIQHHWAHIASVLSQYQLKEKVIGLVCDGTGFGTDSAIWGCECLICDLTGFDRFAHLKYFPLAGGDKAAKQAIRPLLGLLKTTTKTNFKLNDYRWLLDKIEPDQDKLNIINSQIDKNINTAKTSSLGRVFDAVAAAVGLGNYNNFEAQLPMALEAIIQPGCDKY